jgi:hypothetical protein
VKDGGFPILGEVGQIAGCVEFAWNGFAIENAAFARKPYFAACVRKCKIFQQAKFVDELHLVQQLEHNLAREASLVCGRRKRESRRDRDDQSARSGTHLPEQLAQHC